MSEQRQTDLMVDETYVHMKRLAASYLQLESSTVTLSPTVLVHEAYVKLSKQVSDKYQSRGHFLAIAAMVMRRILVDHSRARHRIKRGGERVRVVFDEDATHDSLMQLFYMGRFSEISNNSKFNEFVRLLAQCISPDPNDRPRSMSEIGAKLANIATAFPWSELQSEKWWQENEQELIASSKFKEASVK